MTRSSVNLPYLVLTGVLIAAVLSGTFFFTTQWRSIKALQEEQAQLTKKIINQKNFVDSVDQKIASLRGKVNQENELAVILPTDPAFDDFLRIIERLAAGSGVQLIEVSDTSDSAQATIRARSARGQSSLPAQVVPLGANLRVAGNYQQVRQFIQELESSARLFQVQSVNIDRNEQQIELLGAQVMLQYYSFNPSS